MRRIAFVMMIWITIHGVAGATMWFTDIDNTTGPWDGSLQYPFATIQEAMNVAGSGDQVVVQSGTYLENIDFLGKDITVTGFEGALHTVIDGQLVHSVVSFENGESADAVLEGFTITNGLRTEGGGIHISDASPTIRDNIIRHNAAGSYGGGIYTWNSTASIEENHVHGNTAYLYYGGGVYCGNLSAITVTGNTIHHNTAGTYGGGIFCRRSINVITNNFIYQNSAAQSGGGLCARLEIYGPSYITNNTIVLNDAETSGGGLYCMEQASPHFTNNIVWNNTSRAGAQIYLEAGCNPPITYCAVQGGWTGAGNIQADPLFINGAAPDLHLSHHSPCIDRGDNTAPGLPAVDIDGETRIVPRPGGLKPMQKPGYTATVDIGADECVFPLRIRQRR